MVSSILWDQSARRAAFALPFPSTPRRARESLRAALREPCQQMRVTHDDGNRLQEYERPGNIGELRNVIEHAVILSNCASLRRQIPRYDGRAPVEWRRLA